MYLTPNKSLRQALGLLETGNLLLLKLMLRHRGAWRTFPGRVFREYMVLAGEDQWQCRSIFDVVSIQPGTRVVLEHLPGGGVYSPVDELAYLALITQALKPARIFEIGTFRGRTALNFALNSPPGCEVLTMDLPLDGREQMQDGSGSADAEIIRNSVTGIEYRGKDVEHKIQQLYANSLTFDFSPYAGTVDIVFVDGAHHYAAAKSDTDNALHMLRPGGMLIWHDFANYGDYNDVTRAILDTLPGGEIVQIGSTQLATYRKPA